MIAMRQPVGPNGALPPGGLWVEVLRGPPVQGPQPQPVAAVGTATAAAAAGGARCFKPPHPCTCPLLSGVDVLLNKESKRETPSVVTFTAKQRMMGTDAGTPAQCCAPAVACRPAPLPSEPACHPWWWPGC